MKFDFKKIEELVEGEASKERLKELLEPLKELANQRSYGLVWEEPDQGAYDEELAEQELYKNFPFLQELPEKAVLKNPNGKTNMLIEGDNLHALQSLQYTHKGLVDVIYIDPPYNTGNKDFIYNDRYVDAEDSWRHSSWLSFMNKRLMLAKELMSQEGVFYISIDDNEQSQLKLLCDQVFGEQNFVANIPRITKKGGKSSNTIIKNHDYLLIYVKNRMDIFRGLPHYDKNFKHIDEHFDTRGPYKLNQTLDYASLQYSRSLDYPLTIEGKTYYPGSDKAVYEKRMMSNPKSRDWAWRWSKDLVKWGLENDWISISSTNRIYTKTYLNATITKDSEGNYLEEIVPRTKPLFSLDFTKSEYSNDIGKRDFTELNLEQDFEYTKPVDLIKTLLKIHHNKEAVVLDFFAGSGTTGQAVLELNKEEEDGGNRQFILCTNNEVSSDIEIAKMVTLGHIQEFTGRRGTNLHKEWIAELDAFKGTSAYLDFLESDDYKDLGIARAVTQQRVQKVIEGYTTPKGDEIEGIPGNLRYFTVELKEDRQFDEVNESNLIGETVDLIRIKEELFDNVVYKEVEGAPICILEDDSTKVVVVLEYDVLDYQIDEIMKEFSVEDTRLKKIYTSYPTYDYDGVKHQRLPKEILKALKAKENETK